MDRVSSLSRNGDFSFQTLWVPTEQSANKVHLIQIECFYNIPQDDLNGRTYFEDAIINKSGANLIKNIPEIRATAIFQDYMRMLPLNTNEFRYKSVYSKTGGLLNIFNPEITEEMDSELKMLLNNREKKEAINIWKDRNSELWSNLTPALVWAGGGEIESKLLNDFLQELCDLMDGKPFETEGECLISSLEFLRGWQFMKNSICDEKPANAILKERQKIYERKIAFLKEMGIETDFA